MHSIPNRHDDAVRHDEQAHARRCSRCTECTNCEMSAEAARRDLSRLQLAIEIYCRYVSRGKTTGTRGAVASSSGTFQCLWNKYLWSTIPIWKSCKNRVFISI